MQAPDWVLMLPFFTAIVVGMRVIFLGISAEADFRALDSGKAEPKVGIKIDIVRRSAGAEDLVSERKSGRSFAADPTRTLGPIADAPDDGSIVVGDE